jgi:hypothetical protein
MRFPKLYFAVAAAVLSLGMGLAQADELTSLPGQSGPSSDKMAVGIGVICNTSEQAEAYVKLRNDGADITPAVNSVNAREQDPRACGVAAVAFKRDKTLETKNQNGKLVSIVRINVMAGFDGQKWSPVPAMVQYAIMEEAGIAI